MKKIKIKSKIKYKYKRRLFVGLKLIIKAGSALLSLFFGPILGQNRVIINENINKRKQKIKDLKSNSSLRIFRKQLAFYFEIQIPKISIILKEYYKKEFEEAKGGKVSGLNIKIIKIGEPIDGLGELHEVGIRLKNNK